MRTASKRNEAHRAEFLMTEKEERKILAKTSKEVKCVCVGALTAPSRELSRSQAKTVITHARQQTRSREFVGATLIDDQMFANLFKRKLLLTVKLTGPESFHPQMETFQVSLMRALYALALLL